MQFLNTQDWKMTAAVCLVISLFLVIRAFTINPNTGCRRYGWKSLVFLTLTLGLIASIHFFQKQKLSRTYDDVAEINAAITVHDQEYRTASAGLETAFEEFSTTIREFQPAGNPQNDLIAIGNVAGKTLKVGKATIEKFKVLTESARRYQNTLNRAGKIYQFARNNLSDSASEEDALLIQSGKLIRQMASEEEFTELSSAYVDLAEVFEKLAHMTESRYAEVEVSMPALREAIYYVERANRYLQTVQTHASTLQGFHSPEEILTDIKIYQEGVKEVTESIRALNQRLGEVNVTQF